MAGAQRAPGRRALSRDQRAARAAGLEELWRRAEMGRGGGMRLPIRITLEEAERAHAEWGCNCGPAALAAIMGISLDQVRPHMGDFERKGYTNPTLMFAALDSVGARWKNNGQRCDWPIYGLCRIQWE